MYGKMHWTISYCSRRRKWAGEYTIGEKTTIELSFAEAKVNHGLRYARMLGIRNMREQSFLTAAVQNIKRLVLLACLCIQTQTLPVLF